MSEPTSEETISFSFATSNEALSDHDRWIADFRQLHNDVGRIAFTTVDHHPGDQDKVTAHHEHVGELLEAYLAVRGRLDRTEEAAAQARAEAAELRIRLQAADGALATQEQQLREDIAAALFKRSADLVIEAGGHHDDTMAAIISAEAQGFSNAALFIRDRTEQIPDDE